MTLAHTNVFVSGTEGYHTIRIPVIETASDGSLIAVAEGRKYNAADPGHQNNEINLVCKRSSDGGKTWSALKVIDDPGERWAACNPTTVVDRDTARVWLLYTRTKPGCSSRTSRPGTDDATAWVRFSDDHGASWSEPTDITQAVRDYENWGGTFFGPGGAIQDRGGRLIVPLAFSHGLRNLADDAPPIMGNALVIFSDDHGQTWQRGDLITDDNRGDESQLVELADGKILIDVRQNAGPHRWFLTSGNGGMTWSQPRPGHEVTPVACAIQRYTLASTGDDRDRIVWTGPRGPKRRTLVVRISYDEGKTFTIERVISQDMAAYSDLTIMKDKRVGVLWERGIESNYQYVTFTSLGLEFLETAGS